jgi:hypothetical protein
MADASISLDLSQGNAPSSAPHAEQACASVNLAEQAEMSFATEQPAEARIFLG